MRRGLALLLLLSGIAAYDLPTSFSVADSKQLERALLHSAPTIENVYHLSSALRSALSFPASTPPDVALARHSRGAPSLPHLGRFCAGTLRLTCSYPLVAACSRAAL